MASFCDLNEQLIGELGPVVTQGQGEMVYFAGRNLPPPPTAFAVRFPRISLTLEGTDEMEIERDGHACTIQVRQGEAVFVPPNCWNRPTWNRRAKVLHLLFGEKLIGISLVENNGGGVEGEGVLKSGLPRHPNDATGDMLNALAAVGAQQQKGPADRLLVGALLHTILQSLQNPAATSGSNKARDRFERLCLYVQEHCHQDISRESVAAQFQLNPNYLSRLFQREVLMRFTDYVTQVRIDRAKYLLENYNVALAEIAGVSGFRDTAYFCRVFKQRTQQTPISYRRATWEPDRHKLAVAA